jgi:translation initiation factor 2 alpha subunit (eIF-2alpha)
MTATVEIQRLPEEGEIVIATVKEATGHGAYVRLDEYYMTGWIRNVERYVRPKQKVVLKVIRVNKMRGEVDASLKQVSGDERKSKIKSTLAGFESGKGGAITAVSSVGAPRYRIVVSAENFKVAEKSMNNAVEKIRTEMEKQHGAFNFTNEESKKARQSG